MPDNGAVRPRSAAVAGTAAGALGIVREMLANHFISYLSSFLGFVIIMLVARILGADQFAWVAAGIAFGGFIIPLTALGSDLTFVRDAVAVADGRSIRRMAITTFGMRASVALVLALLLLIGAPLYAHSVLSGIAVACLASWAGLQGLYAAAWFDFLGKTRYQNSIVLVERIATLAAVCGMLLLPRPLQTAMTAGVILLLLRVASVIAQVDFWNSVAGFRSFPLRFYIPRIRPGINLRVTAASVANAMLIYGNQLFLGSDRVQLASYGLAFQIMGLIAIFQYQTLRMVTRGITESCRSRKAILRSALRHALLIGGGSALLAAVGLAIIYALPQLLSDPKYAVATRFAPVLCIWVILAGAALSVVQHLLALNQESFYLATAIGAGVAAFLLGVWLVPRYHGMAVAVILLCVHAAVTMVNAMRLFVIAARLNPTPQRA